MRFAASEPTDTTAPGTTAKAPLPPSTTASVSPPTTTATPTPPTASSTPSAVEAAPSPHPSSTFEYGPPQGNLREGLDPFPSTGHYLAYSIGLTSEALLASGNVCPAEARERCLLGGGAGILMAGSFREPVHEFGVAYEVSFHDSNNIYQRGVLQQLRGEWRAHPRTMQIVDGVTGFLGAGAGLVGYGDNWGVATYGAAGHAELGTEIDLGIKVSVVVSAAYRALYFRAFTDASQQYRPAGLVHLLGLQLAFSLREPL